MSNVCPVSSEKADQQPPFSLGLSSQSTWIIFLVNLAHRLHRCSLVLLGVISDKMNIAALVFDRVPNLASIQSS